MIVSPQAHSTGTRSGISWDETACLLCGSDRRWPVVEAPDTSTGGRGLRFVVVQCEDCGLCYTCPRPDRRSIAQFYPTDYRPHRSKRDARQETRDAGTKPSRVSRLVSRVSILTTPPPPHSQVRRFVPSSRCSSSDENVQRRGYQLRGSHMLHSVRAARARPSRFQPCRQIGRAHV